MTCPHLEHWKDGSTTCRVATLLAQRENTDRHCKASPDACQVCELQEIPRAANKVTVSLAYSTLFRDKELDLNGKHSYIRAALINGIPEDGPGTRLKKRLSWFASGEHKCDCENHAKMMDMMGTHGCRQNMELIVGWLEEESKRRGLIFSRFIAKTFVAAAINEYESYLNDRRLPVVEN